MAMSSSEKLEKKFPSAEGDGIATEPRVQSFKLMV